MPSVFWIEDEPELLDLVEEELQALEGVSRVEHFRDASSAWKAADKIKADGGPVILDLWIPPGTSPLPPISDPFPARYEGPGVGLHLLHLLRGVLGADWAVFIISGNLTMYIPEHIIDKLNIDKDRIIRKPIDNLRMKKLREGVRAEISRLAQSRIPEGAGRGPDEKLPAS